MPPSYSKELEKLQDKIPPFSDVEAMQILEEELGRPVNSVFSEFSRSSIAAASLGQVTYLYHDCLKSARTSFTGSLLQVMQEMEDMMSEEGCVN